MTDLPIDRQEFKNKLKEEIKQKYLEGYTVEEIRVAYRYNTRASIYHQLGELTLEEKIQHQVNMMRRSNNKKI